jgi:hypothetical protein
MISWAMQAGGPVSLNGERIATRDFPDSWASSRSSEEKTAARTEGTKSTQSMRAMMKAKNCDAIATSGLLVVGESSGGGGERTGGRALERDDGDERPKLG